MPSQSRPITRSRTAALRWLVDAVRGGPVGDPHVQPRRRPPIRQPVSSAAIRSDEADVAEDALVIRLQSGGGTQVDLRAGPTRQVDAEQAVKDGRHFAVRQAHLRV